VICSMYYALNAFKLQDMIACGADIRQFGRESECVEEAAEKIVRYLYRSFVSTDSERALTLVRLYKTVTFDHLDDDLKRSSIANFGSPIKNARYLTLMATAGQVSGWNDRRESQAHSLIPITNHEMLQHNVPIVAQLLAELEIEPNLLRGEESDQYLIEPGQKRFNVFYVPEASGCKFIPDQNMVREFGVRSVIAFGGMLNRNSAFCAVLFANVFIPRESAELFNPLTLSTKNALIYATDFRPLAGRRQLA
jgi:hypothetical protein